ncbi:UNVERIFIED_CONTAM: hypothetical protein GTU68_061755, partial [Idotea baltica]|nr:hypothetical protein [Idotea baltica]
LHEEFTAKRNGLKPFDLEEIQQFRQRNSFLFIGPDEDILMPKSVDWRTKGAVTPVKDQGNCGSCYAFAATGSLEGQHFRKTGKLVSLSEQNIIDCSRPYGNDGCDGGFMDYVYAYVGDNHGIDTEESYPYYAEAESCNFNKKDVGADDKGFFDIKTGNEDDLLKALATVGPISVGIDASVQSFMFYHKGVYNEPRCNSTLLDHGVLAVGYGTDEQGQDYWLVKNSWGTIWGLDGYIKIARNANNMCGIATTASYPLV